jgi:hypothetical protein
MIALFPLIVRQVLLRLSFSVLYFATVTVTNTTEQCTPSPKTNSSSASRIRFV